MSTEVKSKPPAGLFASDWEEQPGLVSSGRRRRLRRLKHPE